MPRIPVDREIERKQKELAICADARSGHYPTVTALATQHGEEEEYIEDVLAKHDIVLLAARSLARPVETPVAVPGSNGDRAGRAKAVSSPTQPTVSATGSNEPLVSSPVMQALGSVEAILELVKGMQGGEKSRVIDTLERCLVPLAQFEPQEVRGVFRLVRKASGFFVE